MKRQETIGYLAPLFWCLFVWSLPASEAEAGRRNRPQQTPSQGPTITCGWVLNGHSTRLVFCGYQVICGQLHAVYEVKPVPNYRWVCSPVKALSE